MMRLWVGIIFNRGYLMATKTALDKTQAEHLITNFFKAFKNAWNEENVTKTSSALSQLLTPKFQISNNGEIAEKSLAGYLQRIQKLKTKYSRVEFSHPSD